jgi:hypothetical protein
VSGRGESPKPDNFEKDFRVLLGKAESLAKYAHSSVGHVTLRGVGPDTMPQMTVWRLHLVATSAYLSIIQCLKTSPSSLGSLTLLRSLVEVWTHLDFIGDDSEGNTAALRAVCLEAGVLHDWIGNDMKIDPALDYEALKAKNSQSVRRLWQMNGGTGTPRIRSYGDVAKSIEKLSRKPELSWINALYGSSSSVTHALGADFLITKTESGIEVTWAEPERRCGWLVHATVCYEYLTRIVFDVCMGSSPLHTFDLQKQSLKILDDPLVPALLGAPVTFHEK